MNILYTNVDDNLRFELDARGKAGFSDRSTTALNFMLGKVANVEVTAYTGNNSATTVVGILGGLQVQGGRYMPSGLEGYLTQKEITQESIDFWTAEQKNADPTNPEIIVGNAYTVPNKYIDSTKRPGPYITDINVSIGDHSMGLLNKATIKFIVSNTTRDLDVVEQTWFRPGRYASIEIQHPESAIITKRLLTPQVLPNRDKVKELYPNWPIDDFEKNVSRMNAFRFEGLITSFDFQYTNDGTVEATLYLTGTSNVYTDISMFINNEKVKDQDETKPASTEDIKTPGRPEFYNILYDRFDSIVKEFTSQPSTNPFISLPTETLNNDTQGPYLLPFTIKDGKNPTNTDRFILVGEPYNQYTNTNTTSPQTIQSRYITLGALIYYINDYVMTKLTGNVSSPEIIFTDQLCYSNYYANLISCDPNDVLFLPKSDLNTTTGQQQELEGELPIDCNTYGELIYYKYFTEQIPWPGVYDKSTTYGRYYPSRIFINMEWIQKTLNNLADKQTKDFSIATFITKICLAIDTASAGAIKLALVTHPSDQTKLMLMDVNFIVDRDDIKRVDEYSVPMFSNHPNGSIVRSFTLSAKLPENAKNLAYVMNSGDQVTNSKLAPFMSFMYNAQNVTQINNLIKQHATDYEKNIEELAISRTKYGQSPGVLELRTSMYKALSEYLKKPHKDFKTSQQMAAPIFPFEASITIDGINGFRYGDVLQFDALPNRYTFNTVFSIIGITHSVSNVGEWTTELKCIMRPKLD